MAVSQRPRSARRTSPSRKPAIAIVPRLPYPKEVKLKDLDILVKQAEVAATRNPNWIGEKMRRSSIAFKYSPASRSIVEQALAEDAARTAAKAA